MPAASAGLVQRLHSSAAAIPTWLGVVDGVVPTATAMLSQEGVLVVVLFMTAVFGP